MRHLDEPHLPRVRFGARGGWLDLSSRGYHETRRARAQEIRLHFSARRTSYKVTDHLQPSCGVVRSRVMLNGWGPNPRRFAVRRREEEFAMTCIRASSTEAFTARRSYLMYEGPWCVGIVSSRIGGWATWLGTLVLLVRFRFGRTSMRVRGSFGDWRLQ
jgi:hypothetical protein